MKKNFLYFVCLCGLLLSFSACEKEEEIKLCGLYGIVTDKTTGEPIKSAGVELKQTGAKQTVAKNVTGSDGAFEFIDLEEGTYTLFITKAGYEDYTSNEIAVNTKTQTVQHSIQLEKLPPALSILDDKGNEVDSLDFGENPEVLMHSFFIFNRGEDTLEWAIVHQCAWISSISKESGNLASNGTQPLVIQIDRNKLLEGQNHTTIHVVSNSGTRQITIAAAFNVKLETLTASDIRTNSVVMNGRISQDFSPSITEYGFVYGTFFAPSIQNGAQIASLSGTPSFGATFNMLVSDLEDDTHYHVRAYATNGLRTMYGEDIEFTTKDGKPIVETTNPGDNITANTIMTGGNVTDDSGFPITARGVAYGSVPYPIIESGNFTTDGTGVGYFGSLITDVNVTTDTYYIRAYATNEKGTSYGEQVIVTPENYDYCAKLKTMVYGGYIYKIKPLGGMAWQEGYDACENMIYGGYSDWFMPDEGEVQSIINAYGKSGRYYINGDEDADFLRIEGYKEIWTVTDCGKMHSFFIINDYMYSPLSYKYWEPSSYCNSQYSSASDSDIYLVFAIRKFRTEE